MNFEELKKSAAKTAEENPVATAAVAFGIGYGLYKGVKKAIKVAKDVKEGYKLQRDVNAGNKVLLTKADYEKVAETDVQVVTKLQELEAREAEAETSKEVKPEEPKKD